MLPRGIQSRLPAHIASVSLDNHLTTATFTSTKAGKGAASAMQLRHKNASKTPSLTRPPAKAATVSAAAVLQEQLQREKVFRGGDVVRVQTNLHGSFEAFEG